MGLASHFNTAAMAVHLKEMRVGGVREAVRQVNHPLNMKMREEGSSLFCANKDLL